jgi:hypothetical protein
VKNTVVDDLTRQVIFLSAATRWNCPRELSRPPLTRYKTADKAS